MSIAAALSTHLDSLMSSDGISVDAVVPRDSPDSLSREVYCILGMPVDAIAMPQVLRHIETAAARKMPFVISTPNVNFLVHSQSDAEFMESLLLSDLCLADGMPIVWIAWLTGIPIRTRVAGSDILASIKIGYNQTQPLAVFLFGGADGVAAAACRALNTEPSGLKCVGSFHPGFGSVDELSVDQIIDKINSSEADFLVASLGAHKGQLWLLRNHHRLHIPVRAHLGATINFEAGSIRRAPRFFQILGLEWLWRIKEEPYLWRRYWHDGRALLRLLSTRALPFAILIRCLKLRYECHRQDLVITHACDDEAVTVSLAGLATIRHVDRIISAFRDAIETNKQIMIDFTNTLAVDARFLGILLMLKKELNSSGTSLILLGLSPGLERMFRLGGLASLLNLHKSA
jgi:N-acetylglucosaminyldiphosphoundecaprenol N-acetyl-beta-D-mannosaminyltransferase